MSRSTVKNTPRPRATKAQGAVTLSKPDPIFAAIAAHDKACAAIMAYCDRGEDVPAKAALARRPELRALARTVPLSPEGVRALGAHVAKWWHNFFNDVADPDIRRMFRSLASAMPTATGKAPKSAWASDPTWAAIANYKKAYAAWLPLATADGKTEDQPKKHAKVMRAYDKAWRKCERLQDTFGKTVPTTALGLLAFMQHMHWLAKEGQIEADDPAWESLIRSVRLLHGLGGRGRS